MGRVVISISTIPSRVNKIRLMLESVLRQSYRADRVVLWIPDRCDKEGCGYNIDRGLLDWMGSKGIEVGRCGRDWGSATKLIPMLKSELDGDTRIITLDDDIIYEEHLVEELLKYSYRWSGSSYGYMGCFGRGDYVHAEELWRLNLERIGVDALGGYRGIIYERRMFGEDIIMETEELLREGVFVVDDQLFGWYLRRKGICRYVIRTNYIGVGGGINFIFLGLGGGIYDGDQRLAKSSMERLRRYYEARGWSYR